MKLVINKTSWKSMKNKIRQWNKLINKLCKNNRNQIRKMYNHKIHNKFLNNKFNCNNNSNNNNNNRNYNLVQKKM